VTAGAGSSASPIPPEAVEAAERILAALPDVPPGPWTVHEFDRDTHAVYDGADMLVETVYGGRRQLAEFLASVRSDVETLAQTVRVMVTSAPSARATVPQSHHQSDTDPIETEETTHGRRN
jgi:hypothetical protein